MTTQPSAISKRENALRTLERPRRLGPPTPGFAGPGHTAVEVIAPNALVETDPFVLLMDDRIDFPPGQQIGGPHPHAGLETVTFVLEGSLDDRDEGLLHAGDAVWMTAGRGVIHNEHVRATGASRILQLWITLPEKDRSAPPRLDVIRLADLPIHRASGVEARIYSGTAKGLTSPTRNHVPTTLIDVHLEPNATFELDLPASYNGFVLPITGAVRVSGDPVVTGEIGWLDRREGNDLTVLRIHGGEAGARALFYAGERQNEPTVHHGPFVAGSIASIEHMFRDYRAGRFTRISELAPSH